MSHICNAMETLTKYCEAIKNAQDKIQCHFNETEPMAPIQTLVIKKLSKFYRTQKLNRKPAQPIRAPSAQDEINVKDK